MTPAVGQVWQDNDPRIAYGRRGDRLVRIHDIEDGKAICQAWYTEESRSRTVRIRLDRFKPNSTGYRYLRTELWS